MVTQEKLTFRLSKTAGNAPKTECAGHVLAVFFVNCHHCTTNIIVKLDGNSNAIGALTMIVFNTDFPFIPCDC